VAVIAVVTIPSDESTVSTSELDATETTPMTPATNGWLVVDSGDGLSLVRPTVDDQRIDIPGSASVEEPCPAWSPDGTRLMFGRVTSSTPGRLGPATTFDDAEVVIVPVDRNGTVGAPKVIPLDGFDAHVCGIWAPDSRWVAFAGGGEVWVVDTLTGEIRRLPGLRPVDLEWRPGTDELTIAGDQGITWESAPVTVYSVSTEELHPLGAVRAAEITWSPDGSTMAYRGGEEDQPPVGDATGLWLVDADGTNERLLVADTGHAVHGIGPVWSPTGERIVYQRRCCGRVETHELVLVDVVDGAETVIAQPRTDGPSGSVPLWPVNATWSPDGTMLVGSAWPEWLDGGDLSRLFVVAADTPTDVTVMSDANIPVGFGSEHRWALLQVWGRRPG
jgi:Tol biopolymer transport system component